MNILNLSFVFQHNTMGINCDLCEDGYWRPSGTDPADPYGCRPCDCDPYGSTGACIKDDTYGCEGLVSAN